MTVTQERCPKVVHKNGFFDLREAFVSLHSGTDPRLVFPLLTRPLTMRDVTSLHVRSVQTDGVRDAVSTMKLALALDASIAFSGTEVQKLRDRRRRSDAITSEDIRRSGFIGRAIDSACYHGREAVKYVAHESASSPFFTWTVALMRPVLSDEVLLDPDGAKESISSALSDLGISTARDVLPLYFRTVIGGYKFRGARREYPSFEKFIELSRNSHILLMAPTTLDSNLLGIYGTQVYGGEMGGNNSAPVVRNLEVRTLRNGEEQVTLSKTGRLAVENEYAKDFYDKDSPEERVNPHRITGCPAAKQITIRGVTYPSLLETILERTIDNFPPMLERRKIWNLKKILQRK